MAVGPANEPTIPMAPRAVNSVPGEGQCHAMHIKKIPDPTVQQKMKQGRSTSVLVIGGGLTAAQIGERCIMKGISKVYLLMRSELKVKPIDVSLDWVGKFKNHEHATFWSADSDEGMSITLSLYPCSHADTISHREISNDSPCEDGRQSNTHLPQEDEGSYRCREAVYAHPHQDSIARMGQWNEILDRHNLTTT